MKVIAFLCCLVLSASLASAASFPPESSSEVDIYTDTELFRAICDQKAVIWIRADLDLREKHWPTDCTAPVILKSNMTISGPLDEPLNYIVSFNFMARKVVIKPYGEVRLRHFTARNTRRGGGGEIDFIAYSPRGILWTDDLNKNQIICLHTDPSKLAGLPLPVNFPQFANKTQIVQLWDSYCTPRQCWNETLHYDQFFTDVNVGSDSETGGYVMAKNNASKTCDQFVTDSCIQAHGGEACMAAVIDDFMQHLTTPLDGSGGVSPLAIGLPVGLGGGGVLMGAVIAAVLLNHRRRRRRRLSGQTDPGSCGAIPKLFTKDEDLEYGNGGDGGGGDNGVSGAFRAPGVRHQSCEPPGGSSRDGESRSSKEVASCISDDPGALVPRVAVVVAVGSAAFATSHAGVAAVAGSDGDGGKEKVGSDQEQQAAHMVVEGRGTEGSFRFETGGDMGRCLSAGVRRPTLTPSSSYPAACSTAALVEGVMEDGCVCTIAVGAPLGQGSYGIVFKGVWQDKTVAAKLILCDPNCTEQVATEVRLMTSEACRHANLLRAYTVLTRAKVINRQQSAAQALQSTIRTLSSSSSQRRQQVSHSEAVQQIMRPDGGKSNSGSNADLVETWILSEYCDLGALAPHVHIAKRFLFPQDAGSPSSIAAAVGSEQGPGAVPLRRPHLALILSVLRDIAAGMKHLHSLNIVHGDLKMANVLLSSRYMESTGAAAGSGAEGIPPTGSGSEQVSGGANPTAAIPFLSPSSASRDTSRSLGQLHSELVAKVADFGLSRWLKEGQTHHSTKTVGTVTHMPPELLRSGKLTLSGDVYSFGIIMWELVTGSVPYRGLLYGEVVERVVVSHRRPEFPEHTPRDYRSLAERCWAADAMARPNFAAVLVELEAMLAAVAVLQAESDMLYAAIMPLPPPVAPLETSTAPPSPVAYRLGRD